MVRGLETSREVLPSWVPLPPLPCFPGLISVIRPLQEAASGFSCLFVTYRAPDLSIPGKTSEWRSGRTLPDLLLRRRGRPRSRRVNEGPGQGPSSPRLGANRRVQADMQRLRGWGHVSRSHSRGLEPWPVPTSLVPRRPGQVPSHRLSNASFHQSSRACGSRPASLTVDKASLVGACQSLCLPVLPSVPSAPPPCPAQAGSALTGPAPLPAVLLNGSSLVTASSRGPA